jgi:DNA-binding Lrp family transcriptional regulator
MTAANLIALIGVILSALAGTGGAGYAVVQWWLKRHDEEAQANAAKILTDASVTVIAELNRERSDLKNEMRAVNDEVKQFRQTVREFLEAVYEIIPLVRAETSELAQLRETMRNVQREL